jgi:hypothetical protein
VREQPASGIDGATVSLPLRRSSSWTFIADMTTSMPQANASSNPTSAHWWGPMIDLVLLFKQLRPQEPLIIRTAPLACLQCIQIGTHSRLMLALLGV